MPSGEKVPRAPEPMPASQPDTGPGHLSRRSVLRSAAGAGAAGLAMTALAGPALAGSPALAASRPASHHAGPADARDLADDAAGGVVVHVRDVRTGDIDIYRGTGHVRMQDRDLAARLARASQ